MVSADTLSRILVNRLGIPPQFVGYRHLPTVSLQEYCESQSLPAVTIDPKQSVECPLPRSVETASELSTEPGRYERSMADVPRLAVAPTTVATVRDCRVLCHRNKWNDDFYAVVTPDQRLLNITGLGYRPEHAERLRTPKRVRRIDRATWVVAHSTSNHYMWLYVHMPRLLVAESLNDAGPVLYPAEDKLNRVKRSIVERAGLSPEAFLQPDDEVLEIEELTLVDACTFNPRLVKQLRDATTSNISSSEGSPVFISRSKCRFRRLINEPDVLSDLSRFNFETVRFEEFTLDEQIATMARAPVVVAPHGAGLANILFCRPGTHIVEIQDPEDPNPHFYAIAAILGLHYWLVTADVNPSEEPHFRDLTAPRPGLNRILEQIFDEIGTTTSRVSVGV